MPKPTPTESSAADVPSSCIVKAHPGYATMRGIVGSTPAATGTSFRSTSLPFLGASLSCLAQRLVGAPKRLSRVEEGGVTEHCRDGELW